jgi:hypothetical protein
MSSYKETDKIRKEYHEWLKSRVNMVRKDTSLTDKRIFVLLDALLVEIDHMGNDFLERIKKLAEQTNSLWTYTSAMGNAVISLTKKVEYIGPVTKRLSQLEEKQQDLLTMKKRLIHMFNKKLNRYEIESSNKRSELIKTYLV